MPPSLCTEDLAENSLKSISRVMEKDNVIDDVEDEEVSGTAASTSSKNNKKKKKKKAAAKEEKAKTATVSAAGKAILAKQQQRAAEEAALKKKQEEEEARIREQEAREEEERKKAEAIREEKRRKKAEKIEAQKAAGTYMTKAEKDKAKKTQARLEAMKAAGMLDVGKLADNDKEDKASTPKSTAAMFSKKKKKGGKGAKKSEEKPDEVSPDDVILKDDEDESENKNESEGTSLSLPVLDSWDDAAGAGDWDDSSNVNEVVANLEAIKLSSGIGFEDEDTLNSEKIAEQKKLKELGLERQRRAEEERVKREEEEREREEMEKKEREAAMRKEISRANRHAREEKARAARTPDHLRCPISCIMGHVDTGKTKLLDKIRHTSVQEGEAGGITQQIGATQFSRDTLIAQTQCLQAKDPFDINLPGLLVIDTPGHESFTNLRSRGSSLCDIAILVIDLMHGLEQQTIESITMLRNKRAPFIVALNKIDRCYDWQTVRDRSSREALECQSESVRQEFKDKSERIIVQLMELGLNSKLYWENDDLARTVSLVPTSAVTGEGIPDLLRMLITLTQERLTEKLMFMDVLQCTVLEVKVIDGLGHTVDVILVNGTLREGDTIVVSTLEGPVVTTIRGLLTPPPNKEMRVKSEYVHHKEITGAVGVKLVATDISRAVAGTTVLVKQEEDDIEDIKEEVQSDLTSVYKALSTENKGVTVHASTLGALEALLQFLRDECTPPIPVCHVSIGPIHKKDVMRANIMNERGHPEFASILAFDVKADTEADEMAEELKVRIFKADIIYHLFDQFTAYMSKFIEERRKAAESIAVHPVVLKIMPQHIFNKKDPMVFGVEVVDGILKIGTPLVIPSNDFLFIGNVIGIENNRKEIQQAKKGSSVAIKISNPSNPNITYGRQFDHNGAVYSRISRESIDALKEFFKTEVAKEDWHLLVKMKKVFGIQ